METLFSHFLLLLACCPRIFGLMALAPGFSFTVVPPLVRIIVAAAIACAITPLLGTPLERLASLAPEAYVLLLIGELCLGGLLGYLLACLVESARLAGEWIDMQIGFRIGAFYDPATEASVSVLGRVWHWLAIVFFFAVNGHHLLLQGLVRSYDICPLGAAVFQRELIPLAVQALQACFVLALQMAAPVMAALILADLTLGLVGRTIPQMQLMLVGLPGKILVGLGALALCLPQMNNLLWQMLEQFSRFFYAALRLVSP